MSTELDEIAIIKGLFELISSATAPDFFTEEELAVYLRLVNEEGKPKTAGIKKWAARPPEENPLPRRYIGDLPRYFRPDVIRWTEEETRRQQNKTSHKDDGNVTRLHVEGNNSAALTASAQ